MGRRSHPLVISVIPFQKLTLHMTTEPYGKKNPFPAPVLSVKHLTGEGSPKETIHIEYSLDGA